MAIGDAIFKIGFVIYPYLKKLLHLPFECSNNEFLGFITSGIGNPLFTIYVIEDQQRFGFARFLVDVDVDYALPKELVVDVGDGKLITVGVEYPWLPIKCTRCKSLGDPMHACT